MVKFKDIVDFYIDGFSDLSDWSRALWIIILAKLFIMFVVLNLFFFQNEMKVRFDNDQDRANHVIEQITIP